MSTSQVSRIDTSSRARQNYHKLPNSSSWVLTPEAAVERISQQFSPVPGQSPFYMTAGNEQQILGDLVSHNVPVVISGPPGIGKMSLVRSVFHRLRIPHQVFVASTATPVHQLLGCEGTAGAHGELSGWQDGVLSLAARAASGGLVNGLFLDELLNLPGEILSYIFSVIDGRNVLSLPNGEEIKTNGNLRLVFSYNPDPGHRLDNVLRSRLAAIRLGYPSHETEVHILEGENTGNLCRLQAGSEIANGLISFANVIRRALGYEVETSHPELTERENELLRLMPMPPSTRLLVISAKMISSGMYSTHEAVRNFLLPPLLQDTFGSEVPLLTQALVDLMNKYIPNMMSPRHIADSDMDTLLARHEPAPSESEDRRETPVPASFNWRPKH